MPDIAETQKSPFNSTLKWVGMEKVAIPLYLNGSFRVPAQADIFVNVNQAEAKGIHMSRLFLALEDGFKEQSLSVDLVKKILTSFVESQKGLSDSARIVLSWEELLERKALLSDYSGWKTYPVKLSAEVVNGVFDINLEFSIFYSSTCPCSAALSRQLFQKAFAKEFFEDNLTFDKAFDWLGKNQIASAHSQRSRADIKMKLSRGSGDLNITSYVDALEGELKTPVQTAVKREDEQEFARLNGENTMFVEDALRKMKKVMKTFDDLESFEIKTHHYESLHAHDAVGVISSVD
ncbi:MAG: GTP cyclohydrolase I FolE2 [Bdellovibrionales bacterium]|nr:GTP cyclohydrolase I FolE2 [Bdellovibrionales bacterium]